MRILAVFHDNNLNSGATKSFLSNILYINSQDNMQVIAIVPKKEGSLANLLRDNKIETYQMRYGGNVYDAKNRGIYKALAYARCLVKSMISFANCEKSARMLCSLGIDAVYSNTSTIYFGALLARKMKVKHYWHFREFGLDDQGSCHIFPRLYLSLMKQSKYIFTISNILDTYYRNKYRLSNTVVLYNDISKEYINNQKKKHSTINVLITGTLCENKGQMFAIKSLGNKENIMLYVAGKINSYGEYIKKYISDNNIKNVKMCGLVTDMSELRKNIDISIVAASREAFGRTIIEDMLSHILVLGCDTGAVPELITDYKTGILYTHGSKEDLIKKLDWIIDNRTDCEKIKEKAFEYAKTFTNENTAKSVFKYITNEMQ